MMVNEGEKVMTVATGWVIRLRHADVRDWEAFADWLDADPSHLEAYDEIAAADKVLDALPPREVRAPEVAAEAVVHAEPVPRRKVLGWALAASVVGVVGYASLHGPNHHYAVETVPGERRVVGLADGSRIELNGDTKVMLDRATPRYARLERGEALFNVVHDASSPFRVEAGDADIEDLGTVFNVSRAGEVVAVEVAEGEVAVAAAGQRAHLTPGMGVRAEGRRLTPSRRDPASVGDWRRGLLSYSSASYEQIAQDLFRNAGLRVQVDPELQGRRFSGVIILGPVKSALMARVAALLTVEARPAGEGWLLVPAEQ
jgi:transmembrane sensor